MIEYRNGADAEGVPAGRKGGFGMDQLRRQLEEKGIRLTAQRDAVLHAIKDSGGEHLTVEEIYERTKRSYPDIGIATVYRTVQLFSELGVISGEYLGDTVVRYELCQTGDRHSHHHLRCLKCGRIIEVQDDLTNSLEDMIRERYGFEIADHRVQFTGLCRDCREVRA